MDIHCSNQEAEVLQKVAAASELLERDTYLVGGFVRDKLLGRATTDMDFVCLGDALELATKAAA
ncbi:MAG: tRNA nucleotidyltransferase, partial [Chitinophagia bacterium]|nr:tRNA nucleotidyltransferase [Chitinophagia bacterium]